MIRHQHGNEYFLFTQDDHARLSGSLAEQFGNQRFAIPHPRQAVVDAVAMHDSGWPLHDDDPTLDGSGLPLHVFGTPIPLAVRVWAESVRRARAVNLYSGLLVSIHVFALSAVSYQHYSDPDQRQQSAKELFELNKFQQLQIETQESIRQTLGLRTDMALQLGLAPRRSGEEEDLLRANYQVLRAMDQVSLAVLCGGRPFSSLEDVSPRPGAEPVDFRVGYPSEWMVTLQPWPFAIERIEMELPFRRLPAKVYTNLDTFRAAYAAAPREAQRVMVSKTG